jgi:DNA primase
MRHEERRVKMERLASNFHYTLRKYEKAYSYLLNRGITDYLIDKYQIGYCHTKINGYELLYKRIVFPIYNWKGECISFSSRTLNKGVKYLTMNNQVFNKADNVYGLNFALNSIANTRISFIVEGFTDVIGMHSAGLFNTVSSMGLATTFNQAQLVARWAKIIVLVFDGDKRGKQATDKVVLKLRDVGVRLGYVFLPSGIDPWDAYIKYGGGLWEQLIKNKIRLI